MERVYTTSLQYLPEISFGDVEKFVEEHSITKGTKMKKGYKFFHEQFIEKYEVSNVFHGHVFVRAKCYRSQRKNEEPHKLEIKLTADNGRLMAFACSCVAGKGFCNHVVALLLQTAHYSQSGIKTVPPALACTSNLQQWHRPRTQGIRPEPVSEVVMKKTTSAGKSGLQSTLYQAYAGPFPDPDFMAAGLELHEVHPQPLIATVLDGLSAVEMVPSIFGPVPRGCPISYLCPPETANNLIQHHFAPEFPDLPIRMNDPTVSRLAFVPTLHQQLHLQSLQVSLQMATIFEKGTREQSNCPAWVQLRRPRLTASRFRDACASWRGSVDPQTAANSLASQMLRGSTRQTAAMKRGLEMEPAVLKSYAESLMVNVLPVGFVIHPEAPHLGASPDGRVYDPTESPPFGLVEVKCTTKQNASQVAHLKIENGDVILRRSHRYFWQVQGQLAISGLEWCDFVTDTAENVYIQRVRRDNDFVIEMKQKLDLFYYNTYMDVFLQSHR